ncbi:beta-lactamase family protein [Aminobacter anthyllidis]|uniref:Beta-lactamase family protein n=1 Tax=Aminobacter anthyllidis TaxID=1035067 RepID=A0A9X1A8Q9_9HYPH|nr:serine hydrolase domain-containing protein [Aminobacter anthyllidis]MBT1155292.1 beta-lactamase family protein [Aminobacter anthyllidis]
MGWIVAILSLFISTAALAQAALPPTPPGRVLAELLEALNTGDPAKAEAFDRTYRPRDPIAGMGPLREQTGGFELVKVEQSDATTLVAILREKAGDRFARLELGLSADAEPKLSRFKLDPVMPPAGLGAKRLPLADAVAALVKHQDEAAAADSFSGALLIAKDGKVVLEKAWGLADRERKLPVTVDTKFRIGSMNKMFTAVAVLQLVEAGKLGLDEPIGTYLSSYPSKDIAKKVTVRNLLTHTGGTGDIFGSEFDKNRLNLRTIDDYIALYGKRAPLFAPGAGQRYSNYGFILLGALIEKASGMSYEDYVRKNVFAPAGMMSTGSLPETEPVPGRSIGYLNQGGKLVPNTDTLPWRGTSAGGGYSTVGDLWRFAEALQAGKLVSKAMLDLATSTQFPMFGFGFAVVGEGNWKGFGHNGGAPGMSGDLHIFPRLGYVLVSLSNLDPPASTRPLEFIEARLPEAP